MTDLIAFPFSLGKTGAVTVQDDGSDDYYAGELAQLILTNLEERELAPDFGITDPAFDDFDEVEYVSKVTMFGPPVSITDVQQDYVGGDRTLVTITFDSVDDLEDSDFVDDDVDQEFYEGDN